MSSTSPPKQKETGTPVLGTVTPAAEEPSEATAASSEPVLEDDNGYMEEEEEDDEEGLEVPLPKLQHLLEG